ncbi:hypothetical protein VTI74DRAFT_6525 [Chaetomium olivicolor]
MISPTTRRTSLTRLLRPLLPSFVADELLPSKPTATSAEKRTPRLHPTSYLDGMRGIAAIIVFICHYTENNFSALTPSYGLNPHGNRSSPLQLPLLRLVFSGRPMVHIFFVISGFALSYKPLGHLRAGNTEGCYAALASSAFRRPFRLFGPCVVSTALIAVMRQLGWLTTAPVWTKETWGDEFAKWRWAVLHQIAWPWAWDRDLRPAYDVHLWTIPIEFAHSMLLFMVILGLARVRKGVRRVAVLGLMGYCLVCGKWAGFEFLGGMLLAEGHVAKMARTKGWEGGAYGAGEEGEPNWVLRAVQILLVVLGLFIAGWPNEDAAKTPGIKHLLAWTPSPFADMDHLAPQKFWFGLSALATVWAVGDLECLRETFESPLAQYCGRISYAVYICHGPVEELSRGWLIGNAFTPAYGEPGALDYEPAMPARGVKGIIGVKTVTQVTLGWFAGLCLFAPLVIWAADVFSRLVDNRIVSLARRLEMVCLDDAELSPSSQRYSTAA